MITTFKVGQKVKGRTIVKIKEPSVLWKRTHPGNWVWLYFEGQIGGFCSKLYKK